MWLQKHGVSVRPSLSTKKIQEITAVFELFDEDDSGAIVVEEAHTALKLLGLRATKSQVAKLVEKYDVNDSGDLDIDEFIQMMTEHLVDQEDAEAEEGDEFDINSLKDSGFNTNELNLVLGALRRRNLLQALLEKDYKGLDLQQRRLRQRAGLGAEAHPRAAIRGKGPPQGGLDGDAHDGADQEGQEGVDDDVLQVEAEAEAAEDSGSQKKVASGRPGIPGAQGQVLHRQVAAARGGKQLQRDRGGSRKASTRRRC